MESFQTGDQIVEILNIWCVVTWLSCLSSVNCIFWSSPLPNYSVNWNSGLWELYFWGLLIFVLIHNVDLLQNLIPLEIFSIVNWIENFSIVRYNLIIALCGVNIKIVNTPWIVSCWVKSLCFVFTFLDVHYTLRYFNIPVQDAKACDLELCH